MTDPGEEEAGNEICILDEDESDEELIDVEEIWKDTLFSNLFIFCILTFVLRLCWRKFLQITKIQIFYKRPILNPKF